MDPISLGLLAALAGGAGGELGKQCWSGLTTLVRRPFQHQAAAAVSSGEVELVALERAPGDAEVAARLNAALAVRAALEPEFGTDLAQWHSRAQEAVSGGDHIHLEIHDGTFNDAVFQVGKVNTMSGLPAAAPPSGGPLSQG